MTMQEIERSIRGDLKLLGDSLNRMQYLLDCGKAARGIPPAERTDAALVRDCQMKTWLLTSWNGGRLRIRSDSESLLVKGALSLLEEIYDGRSPAEVAGYSFGLLDDPDFSALFDAAQKKGIQGILNKLQEGDGDAVPG